MMTTPVFYAFVSNAAPQIRSLVIENLALEFSEVGSGKPVIIDLDSGSALRIKAGRPSRDDPAARYGDSLASSGIPVLKPHQAADFFEDATKARNAALSDGRVFIALMNEVPPPEAVLFCDAICFAVPQNPASTAFIYGAVKAMEAAGRNLPVRVMMVGEPRIEKAAEFFVAVARELQGIGSGFSELSYAGFMAFDHEESGLASQYGISISEAFPGGVTRGQARQAVRKLFIQDFSELCADWVERERACMKYLGSGKYR